MLYQSVCIFCWSTANGRWGTDLNLRSLATRGLQPRCFGRLHTHRCGVPCRSRTCLFRVAAGHLAARPRGHGAVQRIRTAITWLEARGSTVELEPHGAYHRTRTDTADLARRRSTLELGRHATVRVMEANCNDSSLRRFKGPPQGVCKLLKLEYGRVVAAAGLAPALIRLSGERFTV